MSKKTRRTADDKFVEGCADCAATQMRYTVARVRHTIRRITKRAMIADLGEEIIAAIEAKGKRQGDEANEHKPRATF